MIQGLKHAAAYVGATLQAALVRASPKAGRAPQISYLFVQTSKSTSQLQITLIKEPKIYILRLRYLGSIILENKILYAVSTQKKKKSCQQHRQSSLPITTSNSPLKRLSDDCIYAFYVHAPLRRLQPHGSGPPILLLYVCTCRPGGRLLCS